jgi:hypothetical protein
VVKTDNSLMPLGYPQPGHPATATSEARGGNEKPYSYGFTIGIKKSGRAELSHARHFNAAAHDGAKK